MSITIRTYCMLALTFVLLGCRSGRLEAPVVVNPSNASIQYSEQKFEEDLKKYRDAIDQANVEAATILRNAMIQRVRLEIDANYHKFENKLFENRAGFSTVADWIELGLAGAVGVTGGVQTKTILGIVLTGIKGGRLSIDKNYFREKTTETLMAAMQAERGKRLALITQKMTDGNASQYSWEEAWVDLLNYFYAGTLENALLSISQQTGSQATEAKKDVQEAEEKRAATMFLRSATKEQIYEKRHLVKMLGELYKHNDQETAGLILDEMKIKRSPEQNVFELLDDQIKAVDDPNDPALLRLSNAFRKALTQ